MALEDSLVQAKRLEYFFRKNHLDYKIFATAEEALEQVLEEIPLLIISDIIMPGMDGYQFCKKVKSNTMFGIFVIFASTNNFNAFF